MTALALTFDLLARDQASDKFTKVGNAAEKAGKKGEGFGSSVSKAMGVAAGAFAAVGIASFGKDLLDLSSNAEQSMGGVEAVFKGYADSVKTNSAEAAQALGLSGNSYRELATVIGSQLKNAGVPLEDLGVSTDKLITQGADLSAMFGGTTQEAVDALSSALKGEMDPIEKYGISLNDAALKAEAMSLGLYSGKGNLDANAKSMAVMSLVTKQGADSVGAFGRESDTAAGKQARATAQWENLKTTLGDHLLPIWTGLVGVVNDKVLPGLERVSGYAQQAFDILFRGDFTGGPLAEDSGIVDTLFNLRDGFIDFKDKITEFVQGDTFAAWVQIAKDAADKLWGALQVLAGFVTDTLIPAFVAVVDAIGTVAEYFRQHQGAAEALGIAVGVVAALVVAAWALQVGAAIAGAAASVIAWFTVATGSGESAAIQSLSTAQVVFGWIAAAASAVVNAAIVVGGWVLMGAQSLIQAARMAAAWFIALGPIGWVVAAIVGIVALIIANWDTVVSWTKTAWEAVSGAIGAAWDAITGFVSSAVGKIKGWISGAWDSVKTTTTNAWDGVKTAVSTGISGVVDFVSGLPGKIVSALGDVGSILLGAGKSVIQGFLDGITGAFDSVKKKLGDLTSLLPDWKGPAGKDAVILRDAGRLVMGGFEDGLTSKFGDVKRTLGGLTGDLSAVGSVGISSSAVGSSINPASSGISASASPANYTIYAQFGTETIEARTVRVASDVTASALNAAILRGVS